MNNETITSENSAKPALLVGAWLTGLLALDACFLIAATEIGQGSQESFVLVVAAIVNVPLFLVAAFVSAGKTQR